MVTRHSDTCHVSRVTVPHVSPDRLPYMTQLVARGRRVMQASATSTSLCSISRQGEEAYL